MFCWMYIESNTHYSSYFLYTLEEEANGDTDGKVILGKNNADQQEIL